MTASPPARLPGAGPAPATALLVTRDRPLLDDLARLAAAAGCALEVAQDATAALRSWRAVPLVLVGADQVEALGAQLPPRRDAVHVVAPEPADDRTLRGALLVGAAGVVELPEGESWLTELLTDAVDGSDPEIAAGRRLAGAGDRRLARVGTIGVVAGSGGAGATTLACAIALTAARTRSASLVDLDPLGPGIDRVVGLDGAVGARWEGLVSSPGRLGSRSLRAALPARGGLAVLTWGPGRPVGLDAATVREVLSAARRGGDLVVVDLPRALDPMSAEVVTRCDRIVVVTEPTVSGVAATGRVVAGLRALTSGLGLAVRRGPATVPASRAAAALDLPLLTVVPRHRRLAEHVDLGLGPVHGVRSPLGRAARACLEPGGPAEASR